MAEPTRIIRVTANRCFLGQATLEIPAWASDDRVRAMIRNGGSLASLLSRSISFDRLAGTGLATATVTPVRGGQHPGELHLNLSDLSPALRRDGLQL